MSESDANCLGKAETLRDDVWKIETGRTEHSLKLGDQRWDVSQADKASVRSLGRKYTKNWKRKECDALLKRQEIKIKPIKTEFLVS